MERCAGSALLFDMTEIRHYRTDVARPTAPLLPAAPRCSARLARCSRRCSSAVLQ